MNPVLQLHVKLLAKLTQVEFIGHGLEFKEQKSTRLVDVSIKLAVNDSSVEKVCSKLADEAAVVCVVSSVGRPEPGSNVISRARSRT